MSRHLALDPREPPVSVTMPRQGQSPAESSAEPVAAQVGQWPDPPPEPFGEPLDHEPGGPLDEEAAAVTREPARSRRRTERDRSPSAPKPLSEQPLPTGRPAARHHSGVEHGGLRRSRRPVSSLKGTGAKGMRLSKALIALVGSALVAALAGAWAYHSWSDNRALSSGRTAAAAPVVILDGVADTSAVSFLPGHSIQVPVKVENPNPGAVEVSGVETGKVLLAEPVPAGCTEALIKAVAEPGELVIPPGGGVFDATVAMSTTAASDCTGIAFSITFVVTGSVATP